MFGGPFIVGNLKGECLNLLEKYIGPLIIETVEIKQNVRGQSHLEENLRLYQLAEVSPYYSIANIILISLQII